MSTPTRVWFQPGEGIAREVITADIQRYLGNDALVKPGEGTGEYEGVPGYWITAYRNLTSQMVQDLRLDSQRWRAEVQQTQVTYPNSRTHQSRQYYGPTAPAPAPNPADYPQPQPQQSQQQRAYPAQPAHQSYAESSYIHQPYPVGAGQPPSYTTTAYDQGQGQGRAAPTYAYQQGQGQGQGQGQVQVQEGYYPSTQPPRYYQQQQPAAAPQRDQGYQATQPSTATTYYTASDGRTYANPPPQANDSRRRR